MKKSVTIQSDNLLSVVEAARFLGRSRMTIWRWSRKGKLHAIELLGYQFFDIDELRAIKKSENNQATEGAKTPVA